MSEMQPQPKPDPILLSDVEPIHSSLGQPFPNSEKIGDFVEAPLVPACTELFDKGIQTVSSSANQKNVQDGMGFAYIDIDLRSLSVGNQALASKYGSLVRYNQDMPAAIRLAVPVDTKSTVDGVAQQMHDLASIFEPQEPVWAPYYTMDDMRAIYGYQEGESVSPQDFVAEGYYYDENKKEFHLSEELFLMRQQFAD